MKTIPYDIARYLESEEMCQEYFAQVWADADSAEIVRALGHIARARGMSALAAQTGLGRESLYKTFAEGAMPRFDTVLRIIRALGLRMAPGLAPQPPET